MRTSEQSISLAGYLIDHQFTKPAILSVIALSMLITRMALTGSIFFAFLVWNLFLAWIPVLAAYLLSRARYRLVKVTLGGFWLLFLPNAAYLVTDLKHVQGSVIFWYDLVLVLVFALAGLMIAVLSIRQVANLFGRGRYMVKATVVLLSSFGIYIGRELRWNSWDIFLHPLDLLWDLYAQFSSSATFLDLAVFVLLFVILHLILAMILAPRSRDFLNHILIKEGDSLT